MPREYHHVVPPMDASQRELARAFNDLNRVLGEISVRLAYIQQGDAKDVINVGGKKIQNAADAASSGEVTTYDQIHPLQTLDTDSSHYMRIVCGSDLTATRDITITPGDSTRTITLSGSPTLDDWFDQSVKTTDDVVFNQVDVSTLTASRDVITTSSGGLASATQGSHVADATTNHDMTGTDTVDQANLEAALDALGTKINSILVALENGQLLASA